MRKTVILCLILSEFLLAAPAARAQTAPEPKNILVIFSLSPGLPVYEIALEKMTTTLRRDLPGPLNFYVEYLDIGRFPGEHFLRRRFDVIRDKYEHLRIDLLILVGGGILSPIAHYAPFLAKIPNIYLEFETEPKNIPEIFRNSNSAGIVLDSKLGKTLDTALSLHPRATALYVISGSSATDQFYGKLAMALTPAYENRIRVSYLSGLTMQELLEQVDNIPEDGIILYLFFTKDRFGLQYYPREVLKVISGRSKAPIYGIYDSYLGYGIVGGSVISSERAGVKAGELGVRILRGEHPAAFSVVREGLNVDLFDWRELKRWGIDEASLPPGSEVRYRQYSAWDLYKGYIVGGIVFILFQMAVVAFLVVIVAKQKRTEERLRDAEERYRSLYENAPVAYFTMGAEDGAILECNATAVAMLGYDRETALKMKVSDFYSGQESGTREQRSILSRVQQGEAFRDVELQIKKKDGSPLWVRFSAEPVKDAAGRVAEIRGAMADVSERKKAEMEALRTRTELLRVERSSRLGELVASLAHELNQPLAAILSSAQAALRFLQSDRHDPELFRTILQNIVQDDKRAAGVITGLRSMVRKEEREKETLDVNEVVRDVLTLFRGEAVIRQVVIEAELARSLPRISGDKIQLQQVLLNLVLNAAEALSGVPHPRNRIHLSTRAIDGGVQVAVRDFGPGIDPAKMEEIWEPFFTTKDAGMGMGLSVSSSIIREHGGRIWAENNADGGATFTFEIPAAGNSGKLNGKSLSR